MNRNYLYTILLVFSFLLYPLLNHEPNSVHYMRFWLDDYIPLVPFFSIPYVLYIPYIVYTLIFVIYFSRFSKEITVSSLICIAIASSFYIFFQTTVPRPEIIPRDLFSGLVKVIYLVDNPYNCFPSLHTTFTVLAYLYWRKITLRKNTLLLLFSTLVVLSTVLIKQHFVADLAGGVILGVFGYYAGMGISQKRLS